MIIGIDASRATFKEKTGTENYSYSLIKAIAGIDRKNQYILYINRKSNSGIVKQSNFKEICLPSRKLWTQYQLSRFLFQQTPDILFIPAHTLPIIRPSKLKTVVTIHDLGAQYLKQYHQFPHRLYLNRSTEYVLKNATHIIAVSKSTKKEIVENFSINSERVTVIYEGYNREIFNFSQIQNSELKVQSIFQKYKINKPYFLFVGTIQPRKNLLRLIKAFSKIKNRDTQLVLVGKRGWLYNDILNAPQEYKVENRVKFLGYVPEADIPYLYLGARSFVFPSLCEGFGIPLLESMASGCPVITSNISSMSEIAGDAAILVDPYSEISIMKAMEKLLNDNKVSKQLRKKGLERVKMFAWEKTAKETVDVFEKLNS